MTLEILPVTGLPEVRPGDDVAALAAAPLAGAGLRDGDVVVITQKIVSKSEGRIVPDEGDGRASWIERETRRVLARRGDLVIAETAHGLVCANAGVDASNVEAGWLTLLPEDPDASAQRIRAGLGERLGVDVAVIVTDTFGRAWRDGLVDVAIGCAGMAAKVDLRGSRDHGGRELSATVVAVADQVAAAAGIVMVKSARIPIAIVRGVDRSAHGPQAAASLIRPADEDLFRESPLQALSSRRTIRTFAEGDVPADAIERAVEAACTAPAPHGSRPWTFAALRSTAARRRYLAAMAEAWRADLAADGVDPETVARRLARSDAILAEAPLLVVPAIRLDAAHRYPDAERGDAERSMFLLAGGAAIQNLMLAFHAQGYASAWISSSLFCRAAARGALGWDEGWMPLGTVAVGRTPAGAASPRPPLDVSRFLSYPN